MEIGPQFEDDFFEEPACRKIEKSTSYAAKICKPYWFMESIIEDGTSQEVLVTLKQRAACYYHKKDYAKAAEAYAKCLELVPASNNTWKRELLENLARSYLKLGDPEKALEWSLKLDESSINEDQKAISMNLLAAVCHNLGKYKEELEALHFSVHAHKLCPEYWLRLGLCYAGLCKINLPGYSLAKTVEDGDVESEPCCAFKLKQSKTVSSVECAKCPSSPQVKHDESASESVPTMCEVCSLGVKITSACLIRTKTLIDTGGPNQLGAEKDEIIKQKVDDCLKYMEVDQSFIDIASKMLGSDFFALSEACDDSLDSQSSLAAQDNGTGSKE